MPAAWTELRARLDGDDASIDLLAVNLFVARTWDPRIDAAAVRARVDAIAAAIRARLPAHCDARCRLDAMRSHLFGRLLLRAELDATGMYRDLRRSLVPFVVDEGVGYCEGIAYLMVALGDRLDVPLAIVPERQHVNVRFGHGTAQSVDLDPTEGGAAVVRAGEAGDCRARDGVYGVAMIRREVVGMMLGALAGRGGALRRAWLDEAVSLASRSPQVRNNRGVEREAHGDLRGALEDYRASAELDPCVPFGLANQARVLSRLGEEAEATRVFTALRELVAQRDDDEAIVSLALAEAEAAVERGDDPSADRAFLRALPHAPGTWAIAMRIGWARQAQGRYREAADAWRSAALASRDPAISLAWIESMEETGDHAAAAEALATLEREHPAMPRWTLAHAMVARSAGRSTEARNAARECLTRGGIACARGLIILGDVCRRDGDARCARAYDEAFVACPWASPNRRLRTLVREARQRLGH